MDLPDGKYYIGPQRVVTERGSVQGKTQGSLTGNQDSRRIHTVFGITIRESTHMEHLAYVQGLT